jgi:hypothetical protein
MTAVPSCVSWEQAGSPPHAPSPAPPAAILFVKLFCGQGDVQKWIRQTLDLEQLSCCGQQMLILRHLLCCHIATVCDLAAMQRSGIVCCWQRIDVGAARACGLQDICMSWPVSIPL